MLLLTQRNPQSGTNLHDELRKAQSWYVEQKKKEFTKFEYWEVVKNHPYFRFIQTTTLSSSFPFEGTPLVCEMSPTIDLDENEEVLTPQSNPQGPSSPVRPMGVKAAKEARKKGKQKEWLLQMRYAMRLKNALWPIKKIGSPTKNQMMIVRLLYTKRHSPSNARTSI